MSWQKLVGFFKSRATQFGRQTHDFLSPKIGDYMFSHLQFDPLYMFKAVSPRTLVEKGGLEAPLSEEQIRENLRTQALELYQTQNAVKIGNGACDSLEDIMAFAHNNPLTDSTATFYHIYGENIPIILVKAAFGIEWSPYDPVEKERLLITHIHLKQFLAASGVNDRQDLKSGKEVINELAGLEMPYKLPASFRGADISGRPQTLQWLLSGGCEPAAQALIRAIESATPYSVVQDRYADPKLVAFVMENQVPQIGPKLS